MKKKFLIIAIVVTVTGFIGWNAYRIYSVPDIYTDAAVYYNGTLLEYKNIVARKNDDTGLRIEYIGTVNSLVSESEKPDSDFECSSKAFMNARLYRDSCGAYYLCCKNGNLLLLGASGKGTDYTTLAGQDVLIPPLVSAEFTGDS